MAAGWRDILRRSLGWLNSVRVSVAGVLTPAGALTRKVGKAVAGALTPSGALAALFGRAVAGSLTPAGALTRKVGKALVGALTPAGALTRKVGKALVGSLTPSGALTRKVGKALAGLLAPSGSLSALLGTFSQAAAGALAPSSSAWSTAYDSSEVYVYALAVYDGNLYAGTGNGGIVYVFDGSSWSVSYDSPESNIRSLAVYDGNLYAGSGDSGIIYVFNGTTWSTSYDSPATRIYSLAVYDGNLYAGTGNAGIIYTYNGTSWSESYDSPELFILSLAAYGGNLYAGSGNNGIVYVFNGSTWAESYDSPEAVIYSLASYGGNLYAGTANNGIVYVFNGSTWAESVDLPETFVFGLYEANGLLYASTGDDGRIYVFDGSAWAISYDSAATRVYDLASYGGDLYAGSGADGIVYVLVESLARKVSKGPSGSMAPSGALTRKVFKGLSGSMAPSGALTRQVGKALAGSLAPSSSMWSTALDSSETYIYALAVYDGNLYAGTGDNGIVYVFDGDSWSVSYDSPESNIRSLAVYDGNLYAGSGGNGIIYVFDGSTWSTSYDSPATRVYSLAVYDGNLYAGTGNAGIIYTYNGTSWSESYDSPELFILSLAAYGGNLYAGSGNNGIVYVFNGSSWSESYDSPEAVIYSLATYGGNLYAGTANNGIVYVFNGSSWSENVDLPETFVFGLYEANGLLYASTGDDGRIYVFDGSAWAISYDSAATRVYDLASYGGDLYAGSGAEGVVYVLVESLTRKTLKALSGSLAPTGTLSRKIFKGVAGSLTPVGTLGATYTQVLINAQRTLGGVPAFALTIASETGLEDYIVAYHYEELSEERGYLAIWLDNRDDQFDDLSTDYPTLTRGAVVTLARGLMISDYILTDETPLQRWIESTARASTVDLPRCWVESLEYTREGQLLITCIDYWGRLEGWRYATDTEFSAQIHSVIASSILGQVGLTLASGTFGYSTDFTATKYQDGDEKLQDLMAECHEKLYAGLAGEIQWQVLDPAEAAGYTYDFANGTANHPLIGGKIQESTSRYNKIIVIGGPNLEYTGTATDTTEITLIGQTRLLTTENGTLASNAQCVEQAESLLRLEQSQATAARLIARPHFTIALYDVMAAATGPAWGGPTATGRVIEIIEDYDIRRKFKETTWEQELTLGGVFGLAQDAAADISRDRDSRQRRRRQRRRVRRSAEQSRTSPAAAGITTMPGILGIAPLGAIIMWSGATVPTGWALCDGSNGTPDLRDQFIVGSGSTYSIDDTGGAATIDIQHGHGPGSLATDTDSHFHTSNGTLKAKTIENVAAGGAPDLSAGTGSDEKHEHDIEGFTDADIHGHSVTTGTTANALSTAQSVLPPYYSLAFIMRVV